MFITKITISQNERYSVRMVFGDPCEAGADYLLFSPGNIFCLSIWRGGLYGTQQWDVFVLRSSEPGQKGSHIEAVTPGAEILLHAAGKYKSKKVLLWIDALKNNGNELTKLTADFYKAADHRFRVGVAPRQASYIESKLK